MATPSTVSAAVHNSSYWLRLMLGNDHYVKVALWHVLHNTKCDPTYQGLSEDPSKLSKELKDYKIVLNKLKQKRVINKTQWERLFPSDNKPCSKEFDVPLLAVLIQYCTTLPPPKGGWERPDPTDVTSKAHYVLLACAFRNFLCHYGSPSAMLLPEFSNKWDEMEDIINGLKYYVNAYDLKIGSLDPHCSTMLNYLQSKLDNLQSENKINALNRHREIKTLKADIKLLKVVVKNVKTEAENRQKRIFEELHHYEKTTGRCNLYTLKAKLQVGVCSQLNGAYWDAMELFQEVLEQQKAVYGGSHSKTLKTQQIIGECLIHQGNYFEAFCMLYETYEAQLELFGLLHSDVLTTMNFIGVSLRKQGRYCDVDNKDQLQLNSQLLSDTNYTDIENYTNAMSIFIDVYNLRKELLGERHPDTLITKRNIGICLFRQAKFSGAIDIYQNVYEQQSKLFGETHPDTIVTRYRIGLCLVNQGKFEEALNYFNKVYSDHQKLFNKLHPTNIAIVNGIAICLHNQEKYFDAMVFYEEVQDMQIKSLHSKHPDTLRTRYNMLLCSIKQLNIRSGPTVIWTNIQNALNKLEEIYYDQQHVLGRTHPHTLDTKRILYLKMLFSDYNMALLQYQEIYYAQVNILGENHTDTLFTRMCIGIVICFLGDVEHSQVVLKEVYEKQKSLYGASHPYAILTKEVINVFYWGPTIGAWKLLLSRMWNFCFLVWLGVHS